MISFTGPHVKFLVRSIAKAIIVENAGRTGCPYMYKNLMSAIRAVTIYILHQPNHFFFFQELAANSDENSIWNIVGKVPRPNVSPNAYWIWDGINNKVCNACRIKIR